VLGRSGGKQSTGLFSDPPHPFGGVHVTTGAPIDARFPGQWFQSESGLHQNWMRDYDPTTGRYLQADPLGLVDGASVYGYAGQNPGRWIDPRGEEYKPGKTPPGDWPRPPENLCGKKPKWNPIGYWEGKGGKKINWDDRSHGSGLDRRKGPQGGHWDDGSGSGGRWHPDGTPLPFSPLPTELQACDICEESWATPSVPPETGFWAVAGAVSAYIAYSLLYGAATTF
jgi:RHS repeat-associated protein